MRSPVFWMMCGFFAVLLALGGLGLMAPLDYQPPQPEFFVEIFLLTSFWLGWVIFLSTLNYWINEKLCP